MPFIAPWTNHRLLHPTLEGCAHCRSTLFSAFTRSGGEAGFPSKQSWPHATPRPAAPPLPVQNDQHRLAKPCRCQILLETSPPSYMPTHHHPAIAPGLRYLTTTDGLDCLRCLIFHARGILPVSLQPASPCCCSVSSHRAGQAYTEACMPTLHEMARCHRTLSTWDDHPSSLCGSGRKTLRSASSGRMASGRRTPAAHGFGTRPGQSESGRVCPMRWGLWRGSATDSNSSISPVLASLEGDMSQASLSAKRAVLDAPYRPGLLRQRPWLENSLFVCLRAPGDHHDYAALLSCSIIGNKVSLLLT